MPKGDAARKELALRERQLKHHDHLKSNPSHPDHGWKLPSKADLEKRIAKLKSKLGVSGGTRRRRRHRTRSTRRRGGSLMDRDTWKNYWKAKPENQGYPTPQAQEEAADKAYNLAEAANNLIVFSAQGTALPPKTK